MVEFLRYFFYILIKKMTSKKTRKETKKGFAHVIQIT